jgi:hypothetical protein
MNKSANPLTLEAAQRRLADPRRTCHSCGRQVGPEPRGLRVHGMWFHPECAVYRPRRERERPAV